VIVASFGKEFGKKQKRIMAQETAAIHTCVTYMANNCQAFADAQRLAFS
jgi:hypothetical protein